MLKLQQYRLNKNMSVRKLSLATGISRVYLSDIESGKCSNPSINVVCQLCKVFDITPNELIIEDMYRKENERNEEWKYQCN